MRHLKNVSKTTVPARATIVGWFVDLKGETIGPGAIMTQGKQPYVDALWNHEGSINPSNVDDLDLFL